ncbi:TRM11 family SAM-dependent methyltransferase [Thermodesulfovibrio yellowstonii]|uniref:site-specific DNA-methyltransferase (cytosine-N(4)-specific) n=1 Tax=Thermodesulfovibrio yellowstonii TaxID=28262 RepID=A0A9W6LKB6_9BACT|nr:DNA methyltransferase [Thermodesulfovibrio islandicus]GLI54076.1 hypothetical protein TISLANDTSLP1_17690 [Thermodesulfovibrio islandicus]
MDRNLKTKGELMLERAENNFWAYSKGEFSKEDLTLLDNVQFIYELSLAELELKALGIEFEVKNGLREFKILNKSEDINNLIIKKGSYFKSVNGSFTDYFYIIQKNQTRSVNQYLTHWIYPYKGKFHPQMIRALLNIIGLKEGDIVLDPFSGSGTAALEAQLLGINFIGFDISPLCVIQSKVKTESIYAFNEIKELRKEVLSKAFSKISLSNDEYYEFINSLTKNEKVKNFYILARLLAVSDKSRRNRNFVNSFVKNIDLMIASLKDYIDIKNQLQLNLGNCSIEIGDARQLPLPDNSIDGIVTSPPYSIALDYVQNDLHAFKNLGYDFIKMRDDFIGVRGTGKNKIELYNKDMQLSYAEMYRVLKPHRYAIIVIGNATYQGKEIKTVEFTIQKMEKLGFSLDKNISKIIFGLYNVMKKENILIFRKAK